MPASKEQLREQAQSIRERCARAFPDAGTQLSRHRPATVPAGLVVAGYVPVRFEIDPGSLMQSFLEAGATLVLPATDPGGADERLQFRRWQPGETLVPGYVGVPEPAPDAQAIVPNLILVPLLAFDRAGRRLGYGGGYYDRSLAALRADHTIFAMGVAYAEQEIPEVPTESHDQRLDAILTETGYLPLSEVA